MMDIKKEKELNSVDLNDLNILRRLGHKMKTSKPFLINSNIYFRLETSPYNCQGCHCRN